MARAAGSTAEGTKNKAEAHLTPQQMIQMYRFMYLSRRVDDREIMLKRQQKIYFEISGAGHEALLVAAGMAMKPAYDWFFPYYRDRALCLTLGNTPEEQFLQAVGSVDDSRQRRAARCLPIGPAKSSRSSLRLPPPPPNACTPSVALKPAVTSPGVPRQQRSPPDPPTIALSTTSPSTETRSSTFRSVKAPPSQGEVLGGNQQRLQPQASTAPALSSRTQRLRYLCSRWK